MFHEKQSQFELFPGTSSPAEDGIPTRFLSRRFMISLEGLFVAFMVVAIGMVVAFCLGIEHGKQIAHTIKNGHPGISKVPIAAAARPIAPVVNDEPAGMANNAIAPPKIQVVAVPHIDNPPTQPPILAKAVVPSVEADDIQGKDATKKMIDKGYTIQVASFKNQEYAQKEAVDLKKDGYETFVLPKGSHAIVCIGKFSTKDEAEKFCKKIKSKYKDYVIRSL